VVGRVPIEPPIISSSAEPGSTSLIGGESIATVFRFWFPLAISWILMTVGSPTVHAIIVRLPDAGYQLAAFGIAYALTMAIESPVDGALIGGLAMVSGIVGEAGAIPFLSRPAVRKSELAERPGAAIAAIALTVSRFAESGWLWRRARPAPT
jgi:hypothetical protein